MTILPNFTVSMDDQISEFIVRTYLHFYNIANVLNIYSFGEGLNKIRTCHEM